MKYTTHEHDGQRLVLNIIRGLFPKIRYKMTMLNLWANIFRYMFTSSSRSDETLANYTFQGLSKKTIQNDDVKSASQ